MLILALTFLLQTPGVDLPQVTAPSVAAAERSQSQAPPGFEFGSEQAQKPGVGSSDAFYWRATFWAGMALMGVGLLFWAGAAFAVTFLILQGEKDLTVPIATGAVLGVAGLAAFAGGAGLAIFFDE